MAFNFTLSHQSNRARQPFRSSQAWLGTKFGHSRVIAVMLLVCAAAFSARATTAPDPVDPPSRSSVFSYVVKVKIPASSRSVRAWIPLPTSDDFQTISQVRLQAPHGIHIHEGFGSGGHYADFSADPAHVKGPFDVRVTFNVVRYERRVDLTSAADPQTAPPNDVTPFLQADRWAPVDRNIEALSLQQSGGVTDPVQKARKIFEYVVTAGGNPARRPTGARRACDSGGSDCTGFNALFVGMARAAGIPARLQIGFAFPDGEKEGAIPGYHCWAEFYVTGMGWIPLDASRAAEEPEKRNDFFGSIDARRVLISTGRDVQFPTQFQAELSVARLNDLVDPHIEIDGKPCSTYSADFFFQEADVASPISSRKPIYALNDFLDGARQSRSIS